MCPDFDAPTSSPSPTVAAPLPAESDRENTLHAFSQAVAPRLPLPGNRRARSPPTASCSRSMTTGSTGSPTRRPHRRAPYERRRAGPDRRPPTHPDPGRAAQGLSGRPGSTSTPSPAASIDLLADDRRARRVRPGVRQLFGVAGSTGSAACSAPGPPPAAGRSRGESLRALADRGADTSTPVLQMPSTAASSGRRPRGPDRRPPARPRARQARPRLDRRRPRT